MMPSISNVTVKALTVAVVFFLFFAIVGVLRGGVLVSTTPVYDVVNNIAIHDAFQLVNNLSFAEVFKEG